MCHNARTDCTHCYCYYITSSGKVVETAETLVSKQRECCALQEELGASRRSVEVRGWLRGGVGYQNVKDYDCLTAALQVCINRGACGFKIAVSAYACVP